MKLTPYQKAKNKEARAWATFERYKAENKAASVKALLDGCPVIGPIVHSTRKMDKAEDRARKLTLEADRIFYLSK